MRYEIKTTLVRFVAWTVLRVCLSLLLFKTVDLHFIDVLLAAALGIALALDIWLFKCESCHQDRHQHHHRFVQMTPASELDNAYRTLGVNQSWSLKKITIRYRDLMRRNHPDRLNLHRNSAGAINCSQYNAAIAIIRSQRS